MPKGRMCFEAFRRNNWLISALLFVVFFLLFPVCLFKTFPSPEAWHSESFSLIIYIIACLFVWLLAGFCASALTGRDGGYYQFNEYKVCSGYIALIIILLKGTFTGYYDSSSPSRPMNS